MGEPPRIVFAFRVWGVREAWKTEERLSRKESTVKALLVFSNLPVRLTGLAAAAVLATTTVQTTTAPIGPARPATAIPCPPPPRSIVPQDIVNLDGSISFLPAGGSATIATVPPDRWLILTDTELIAASASSIYVREVTTMTTTKRSGLFSMDPFHSSVGLAFAPGSDIRLDNLSATGTVVHYTATGYLARP